MEVRAIHREVALPCAPELAFALLIEPSAIRDWWQAARVIVLPRPGGVWAAAWGEDEDEDDPDYVTVARLRQFEPPRRLVLDDYRYRSRFGPMPFEAEFEVELTVDPRAGGSLVRVRQAGFPAAASADEFYAGCEQGWTDTLAGLLRCALGAGEAPA